MPRSPSLTQTPVETTPGAPISASSGEPRAALTRTEPPVSSVAAPSHGADLSRTICLVCTRLDPAYPFAPSRRILIQRPETPEPESIQADNGQP
jgi:hypothetical protein